MMVRVMIVRIIMASLLAAWITHPAQFIVINSNFSKSPGEEG
jgi:hypothetical protein